MSTPEATISTEERVKFIAKVAKVIGREPELDRNGNPIIKPDEMKKVLSVARGKKELDKP